MLKKIEAYVSGWHMVETGDRIIAGVSGGADSVCLLFVLLELQKKIPFDLAAVHVNHGLRGKDADNDEAYVRALCERLGVELHVYRKDVASIARERRISKEEAGRAARLEAFACTKERIGGTKIALAHHQDDNAETFLLNLARGTGIKGLGGMRPVSGDKIRPLLCVKRSEIETFLSERGISYCTDATNFEDDYTRNRIRNHVLPYMEQNINSSAVLHIAETMSRLQEIQIYLEEQTQIYRDACVKVTESGYIVNKEEYTGVPDVLKAPLLKMVLTDVAGCERDLSSSHVEAMKELMDKQVGRKLQLPYGTEAKRIYEGLAVRKISGMCGEHQVCIDIPNLRVGEAEIVETSLGRISCALLEFQQGNPLDEQKSNTKTFNYDIISDSICIRTRLPGDYISIHPDGRKQKLKSYFINEKIPEEERDMILLVAEGSHILWIVGHRSNPLYRVRKDTKTILKIQIDKGDEENGRIN